jgi:Response regulator containing a CheY-like receiver domain and an HTH DNA-binding domain
MAKIKVLLVDDQTLFVESLKTVLEKEAEDIVIVGKAFNGRDAVDMVASREPDVILMDVRMPEMSGVESTRAILERFPDIKVLMLTTFDDDEYVMEALRFGAVGYLLKNVSPAELVAAIHAVYEGVISIAPKVASKLVNKLFQPADERMADKEPNPPAWMNELSHREKEILSLIAQGYDNKEIAKKLYIGEQTVKNYVSIIYYKLGIRDRVLVAKMATEAGLI